MRHPPFATHPRRTLHVQPLLLLLPLFSTLVASSSNLDVAKLASHPNLIPSMAFAAGGFGGGGKAKATKKKHKKKKALSDFMEPPSKQSIGTNTGPKLDRFGLPVPTEDDLFPPMSEGTEIIPASFEDGRTSKEEVEEVLKDHLSVDLSSFEKEGEMKIRLLHRSPPVLAIDNFFTPSECQECIDLAIKDDEEKVMRVNSATFSSYAQSKRTSTTWFCHYSQVPTLLAKVTNFLKVPLEHCEEPQVVRYRTGEEFSWHYDEVPPTQLENGGQRLATFLVYLNTLDGDKGGGTVFRDLKSQSGKQLTMRPKQGSALLFFPAFRDGRPDDRTLHKGEVAIDEKMISQMWVHEREYSPVVPKGNSHDAAREVVLEKKKELGL